VWVKIDIFPILSLYQYLILFYYYGHCVIFYFFKKLQFLNFSNFQTLKLFRKTLNFKKNKIFQNLKFKKLLKQFYYVLQDDPGIERKLERWKREKEESIET